VRDIETGGSATAERQLDRELVEVEAAIELVRSGLAPSVTIAGMRHGEAILEARHEAAARVGIAVDAVWGPADGDCDIVVRRIEARPEAGTDA